MYHHHHYHHHQFGDPSQSVVSYSDLSLMGGSSSSNNNSDLDNLRHQFGLLDSAHAAGSAYGSAPPSLLQILNPNSNDFPEVPVDSGSGAFLYNSAFPMDFANKGYGAPVMEMSQLGSRKRKKGTCNYKFVEGGSNKNEKKRRERLSKKYQDLKALLPNSTKHDRATIILDSIDYINELLRTLNELNVLVETKHRRREGPRKLETSGTGLLRSSWLQRRSKETNVDVRIVEDEVFIKLTQHKRIDCVLAVSRVLDDLDLDLLHLSGGSMGDSHIFMINAKIHEGSSVYACAIAKKIIEGMKIKHPLFCAN